MNTILIMTATAAIFFIGIQVGYKLRTDKKITNTLKVQKVEEKMSNNEIDTEETTEQINKEEIERLNKIMKNLENFNGTEEGQVDIN